MQVIYSAICLRDFVNNVALGLLPKFQYTGKSQEGALFPGCQILLLPAWVNPDQ